MEQNFNRDEFEQMLRDTTEDFRMYPSRKVWHSIYNDLHPDRKWPSLAVCLLLLTAILYVGVSNNNNISKGSRNLLASSLNSETINNRIQENNIGTPNYKQPNIHSSTLANNNNNNIETGGTISGFDNNSSIASLNFNQKNQNFNNNIVETDTETTIKTKENNKSGYIDHFLLAKNKTEKTNEPDMSANSELISKLNTKDIYSASEDGNFLKNKEILVVDISETSTEINTSTNKITETAKSKTSSISIEEKVWMEDFAFHNKHNRNKWKTNLSIDYYITPSVGYRQLFKNNEFEPASGLLLRTTDNNDVLNQQAAFNFEAGTALLLKLNKRLRLKTGLQLNYTNYITYAHELQHPTQTTVLMNNIQNGNLMPVDYISNYGNILGSNIDKLNNYTLQISMPLGLDYKLAGNDKIKWYMGASIQPSYIIAGNAYLISANNKNYASDPSMLRDWNFNTSIESFVSIKTPGNIHFNVGPQFRYQLLSTYSNQYSYTEKLYNIGLKFGITKKL